MRILAQMTVPSTEGGCRRNSRFTIIELVAKYPRTMPHVSFSEWPDWDLG
ncbi:hypothetical protein [Adhaeretor mobilis]|nr:hypothetical protein [Adhaeretor mobilis]